MKCHGNLSSGKMSHRPRQTRLPEGIAVDIFLHSSFGTFVTILFHDLFTAPSWHTFTSLACGWAVAHARHAITTYVWLTGAATVKHFSRSARILGSGPLRFAVSGIGMSNVKRACTASNPSGASFGKSPEIFL